jgi:hypothetical protein
MLKEILDVDTVYVLTKTEDDYTRTEYYTFEITDAFLDG